MECDKCLCIQKWRDRFWKELKECIEACEDRVIGDINARVGDSKVEEMRARDYGGGENGENVGELISKIKPSNRY